MCEPKRKHNLRETKKGREWEGREHKNKVKQRRAEKSKTKKGRREGRKKRNQIVNM